MDVQSNIDLGPIQTIIKKRFVNEGNTVKTEYLVKWHNLDWDSYGSCTWVPGDAITDADARRLVADFEKVRLSLINIKQIRILPPSSATCPALTCSPDFPKGTTRQPPSGGPLWQPLQWLGPLPQHPPSTPREAPSTSREEQPRAQGQLPLCKPWCPGPRCSTELPAWRLDPEP